MSKMSQLNFALQEEANELGFSTVQEALDNGYTVVMHCENGACEHHLRKKSEMIARREKYYAKRDAELALYEQEAAHKAWLKEKEEALTLLNKTIFRMRCTTFVLHKNNVPNDTMKAYAEWNEQCAKDLERVKDFIKRGEV